MSMQAQSRVHAETEPNNPRFITATATLRPGNQNIFAVSATSIAFTITLPDIAESIGNIICVTAPEGASDDTVTIAINEGGTATGGTLDADDDITVFYNNGRSWVPLYTTT